MNRALLILVAALCATRSSAQTDVDSLKRVLLTAKEDTNKVKLLLELGELLHDAEPRSALGFGEQALDLSVRIGWTARSGRIEELIGYTYNQLSDYPKAIAHLEKSIPLLHAEGDSLRAAGIHWYISDCYESVGDTVRSVAHMHQYLEEAIRSGDEHEIAEAWRGLGYRFEGALKPDQAKACFAKALSVSTIAQDSSEMILALDILGRNSLSTGDTATARIKFMAALDLAKTIRSEWHESYVCHSLSRLFETTRDYRAAINYAQRALTLDERGGGKEFISESEVRLGWRLLHSGAPQFAIAHFSKSLVLSRETGMFRSQIDALEGLLRAYQQVDQRDSAVVYLDLFLASKDSLEKNDQRDELAHMTARTEYRAMLMTDSLAHHHELELKSSEVRKQKLIRNASFGGLAFVALFAAIFLFQRNRIGKEKKRSDELLLNILPSEVAEELKANGEAKAKEFAEVTILFTDFKGFTGISEKLSASELVAELNTCFKAFDNIITAKGIEKIKTIGDAYMAAGGLPVPGQCSAADVVLAGLEMQAFMIARKAERDAQGLPAFDMRVGIHTGPVVAGIVGVKKFAYDIWGDTVNIASRMESAGEVGRVNISESTWALVHTQAGSLFHFTPRGKVSAKGKGEMEMFFVRHSTASA